jgi:hypothetical protein
MISKPKSSDIEWCEKSGPWPNRKKRKRRRTTEDPVHDLDGDIHEGPALAADVSTWHPTHTAAETKS